MNNHSNDTGVFVISLDYELLWGVWDVTTKEKYGTHILGVQQVIPALLEAFEDHNIKATFATVGILFAKDKESLTKFIPDTKPAYSNPDYNVYMKEFATMGNNEQDDPYHYGYALFEMIRQSPHEIATHTFSHYFCLEEGQSAEEFDADIKAAVKIAAANNINMYSLVFPRNQINDLYLPVLADNGIKVYRGNPESWIYKPRKFSAEVPFIRLCRLFDTYFPVSGNNTFKITKQARLPVNIPASRFLKPYNKNLAWLEKLKLKRIMNEMTYAAKNKELYHLWWHPHNFGINTKEHMDNIAVLLKHSQFLHEKYGFANLTMKEAAGS
ncbi:MAG: polysaccharide deacetylase family protein [Chitinophagaceae bacterium]|nr:polysaccharide deacetylase family protein [Chitinophagaceae bacterium]